MITYCKYLSEYPLKRDVSWGFQISWGVQTRRYEVEGTGGYYDEYSEFRAHIVCINRRKGWIHTLLYLLKISRFQKKNHVFLNRILQ